MGKRIDLTGQRFGRLEVVRFNHGSRTEGAFWLCRCDCGTEKVIRAHSLRYKGTKSCGCLSREVHRLQKLKAPGESAFNTVLYRYRQRSRNSGTVFSLSVEEFKNLIDSPCYYCGAAPSNLQACPGGDYRYSGIDRVDNAKGYEPGNVVSCCINCNRAKNARSLEEFVEWVETIYNRFRRKP